MKITNEQMMQRAALMDYDEGDLETRMSCTLTSKKIATLEDKKKKYLETALCRRSNLTPAAWERAQDIAGALRAYCLLTKRGDYSNNQSVYKIVADNIKKVVLELDGTMFDVPDRKAALDSAHAEILTVAMPFFRNVNDVYVEHYRGVSKFYVQVEGHVFGPVSSKRFTVFVVDINDINGL